MINEIHDPEALHDQYRSGEPFPHIVLPDFFSPGVAEEIASELRNCDVEAWLRDEHPQQVLKRTMEDPNRLPPRTAAALRYLNTAPVCQFFSKLTGIEDLRPDPDYAGGGVHVSLPGGHLEVHADFNLHPRTGMHRRVNALIFLNENWDPAWHGQLELWPKDLSRPKVSVNPDLNRMVAFTIRDDAFHGVPSPILCPPDRQRYSLALYYYTQDRPDEDKAPFHWAAWQRKGVERH